MFPWPRDDEAFGLPAKYTNETQEVDVRDILLIPLSEEGHVCLVSQVNHLYDMRGYID